MPVLKTLIDPESKTRFRRMAQTRGLSESEFLRAIALAVIEDEDGEGTEDIAADPRPVAPDAEKADVTRMTVRMPRFLLEAVRARARGKGMAPSRWVAALVQSHLTQEPVMTHDELLVLLASNRELAAIGRNINQIAHALNSARLSNTLSCESDRVRLEELFRLREAIIQDRVAIRALVRASQNSWVSDDAPD